MKRSTYRFWMTVAAAGIPVAVVGVLITNIAVFSAGFGWCFVVAGGTLAIAYQYQPPDEYN